MGIFRRIGGYFSGWLERRIVDPLYEKFSARMDARVAKDEERLEKSIEGHKANARVDLATVVGSSSSGLTAEFQGLKRNFGILSEQFDRHMKDVDSKVSDFIEINTAKVDKAVQGVNALAQQSAVNVSQAEASYDSARKALEETKAAFESAHAGLLELQTQYQLDYAAFQVAAKSVQASITGLEGKVNDWETRAHELLSVDLTAERLERAHENGSKLLNSINEAKEGITDNVLASVRTEMSASVDSAVKDLSMKLQVIADERAYNMIVYCLGIPENRRGIVSWVYDKNGNYEAVRKELKDGSARGWLTRFERDVKENNMNLKYLDAIVRFLGSGYRKRI